MTALGLTENVFNSLVPPRERSASGVRAEIIQPSIGTYICMYALRKQGSAPLVYMQNILIIFTGVHSVCSASLLDPN